MKKRVDEKLESTTQGSIMYCGPDIPGIAKQFTVFINGLPKELTALGEKCPEILKLLRPLIELSEIRRNLVLQGTAENIFYNKILEFRKEMNK